MGRAVSLDVEMRTAPDDLSADELAAALYSGWGIRAGSLSYAPVGFGSHHWTTTDRVGRRWFVTADHTEDGGMVRGVLSAALATTLQLSRYGLEFIVPPLTARSGEILHQVGRYAVSLYPLLDELAVAGEPDLVGMIARLHTATSAAPTYAPVDDFVIPHRQAVTHTLAGSGGPLPSGPYAAPFRDLVAEHRDEISAAFEQYDAAARTLRADRSGWVITHGEPKPDNVMITPDGPVLIDWETLRLAPPARDLWMTGNIDRYTALTGRTIDPDDLELFRLRWDLADLSVFASWFVEPHDRGPDTEIGWRACVDICQNRLGSWLNRS